MAVAYQATDVNRGFTSLGTRGRWQEFEHTALKSVFLVDSRCLPGKGTRQRLRAGSGDYVLVNRRLDWR